MRTITIQAPKGIFTDLMKVLQPIAVKKKEINSVTAEWEFIGTIDCPHAKIKNSKNDRLKNIVFVSSEMGNLKTNY